MAEDQRTPRETEIEVSPPLAIVKVRPSPLFNKRRGSSNGSKGPHGRIDSGGNMLLGFFEKEGGSHKGRIVPFLFASFILLLERLDHGGVSQGRGVAEGPSLRNIPKEPAHDFPGTGLRKVG